MISIHNLSSHLKNMNKLDYRELKPSDWWAINTTTECIHTHQNIYLEMIWNKSEIHAKHSYSQKKNLSFFYQFFPFFFQFSTSFPHEFFNYFHHFPPKSRMKTHLTFQVLTINHNPYSQLYHHPRTTQHLI